MSARLRSALMQLRLDGVPARALDVGCGANAAADLLHDLLPAWTFYGLDTDGDALRRARDNFPAQHLIQADARSLPGLLRARFGLVLLRHPDLYRHRAAWMRIVPTLPALLAPGAALLIALYAPEEVDLIRGLPLPPAFPLNGLCAGQSRRPGSLPAGLQPRDGMTCVPPLRAVLAGASRRARQVPSPRVGRGKRAARLRDARRGEVNRLKWIHSPARRATTTGW